MLGHFRAGFTMHETPVQWLLICCRFTSYAPDPHKPLFPLTWEDWVGYAFAAISLFIAAGGGIGGGGILVPLYILLLGTSSTNPTV